MNQRRFISFLFAALLALWACGCHLPGGQGKPLGLGEYSFFLGNLHAHSVYSGDHAKVVAEKFNKGVRTYAMHTPAEVLEKAKSCGYDFYAITDHSSPEQNEYYAQGFTEAHWRDTLEEVERYTSSSFLALHGFEFSRNRDPEGGGFGHMNVINTASWKSAYVPGNTFEALYDWLAGQDDGLVVAQFNHPSRPFSADPAKDFNDFCGRTKERNDIVVLAEIWNSGDAPWFADTVQRIWALGWKVAPTAGTDVHGTYAIEKRPLRTGVLARSLTKEEILRALRARRVYATVEPGLRLDFRLNGHLMGTALAEQIRSEKLLAAVYVSNPKGTQIDRVEICGGRYDEASARDPAALEPSILCTISPSLKTHISHATFANRGFDFYYAQIYLEGKKDPVAFSSPIWMDNR